MLRISVLQCYTLAMMKGNKNVSEKAVIVDRLVKNFEVTEREQGLFGGVKSLIFPSKKTIHALKSITFGINRGELVGFIGPNGAGKTTTLKILSGLLFPSSGFVQVLGFEPWERRPEFLKQISLVMGQKNQLWWDLPAIDTFQLNKAIYEIPDNKYKETLSDLCRILEVEKLLNIQVRRLSLGQRMRLELIAALLHKPKILFLDEPTIGLDVVAQQRIRDFIFDYNKRYDATIILTSHNMDDLTDLAKRIIIINKGGLLYDGNLKDLISQFAREKIIKVSLGKSADIKKFADIGKVRRYNYPQATLSVPRETSAIAAAELLQNFPITDMTIEEEPIEDIIRRVFRGETAGKNS